MGTDATQVEINPLAETDCGKVFAVDAKVCSLTLFCICSEYNL
jgi:succinyl-CoA synthetase beta subunit